MTPTEMCQHATALCKRVGERAYISIGLNLSTDGPPAFALLYPNWPGEPSIQVKGNDWAVMFAELEIEWVRLADKRGSELIVPMALKIIEIAVRTGEINVFLGYSFNTSDVQRYGREAVACANRISNLGPFSIKEVP